MFVSLNVFHSVCQCVCPYGQRCCCRHVGVITSDGLRLQTESRSRERDGEKRQSHNRKPAPPQQDLESLDYIIYKNTNYIMI